MSLDEQRKSLVGMVGQEQGGLLDRRQKPFQPIVADGVAVDNQAIERCRDQRAEADQWQLRLGLKVEIGLAGNGDVALAGGDKTRRCARIGRATTSGAWSGLTNQSSRIVSVPAARAGRSPCIPPFRLYRLRNPV